MEKPRDSTEEKSPESKIVFVRHVSRGLHGPCGTSIRLNVIAHAGKLTQSADGQYTLCERLGTFDRVDDITSKDVKLAKMTVTYSKETLSSGQRTVDVVCDKNVPVEINHERRKPPKEPIRVNILSPEEFNARGRDAPPLNLPTSVWISVEDEKTGEITELKTQKIAYKVTKDRSRKDLDQHLIQYGRDHPYALDDQCQTLALELDDFLGVPTQPFRMPERVWQSLQPVLERGRIGVRGISSGGSACSDPSSVAFQDLWDLSRSGARETLDATTNFEFLINPEPPLIRWLKDPSPRALEFQLPHTPEFATEMGFGPEREPMFYRRPRPYAQVFHIPSNSNAETFPSNNNAETFPPNSNAETFPPNSNAETRYTLPRYGRRKEDPEIPAGFPDMLHGNTRPGVQQPWSTFKIEEDSNGRFVTRTLGSIFKATWAALEVTAPVFVSVGTDENGTPTAKMGVRLNFG